jgi:hypothetical protein
VTLQKKRAICHLRPAVDFTIDNMGPNGHKVDNSPWTRMPHLRLADVPFRSPTPELTPNGKRSVTISRRHAAIAKSAGHFVRGK